MSTNIPFASNTSSSKSYIRGRVLVLLILIPNSGVSAKLIPKKQNFGSKVEILESEIFTSEIVV